MKITKKRFVLIALFIFPLIFFLVLSTGINNFKKLPVLTQKVKDLNEVDSVQTVTFSDHVSVLCFLGKDIDTKKGGLFNLNQKIYKEFYGYLPFQIIAVYPKGSEDQIQKLRSSIEKFTDMSKWHFIGLSEESISSLFQSLRTNDNLNQFYTNKAYIVDKNSSLRGRNDDKDSVDGLLFGYNFNSVGELNNKMEDDIKVLLYEYRAAFKNKKKADRKKVEL
ncbi:hypothetical protein [Pseudotenacibaculum haliotis]|uniref:Membrane or secreted protein n=1 Tax=Pseudotenacibaculum haliotis TaxID=1862138 RepID=A0ABW5LTW7_9FLAO